MFLLILGIDRSRFLLIWIKISTVAPNNLDEIKIKSLSELTVIKSVISNLQFFVEEKWKIASDKSGSGNTANIGSITFIEDILSGNGIFAHLGEDVFDSYWQNQGKMNVPNPGQEGEIKKLTKLIEFLNFKQMDVSLINHPKSKRKIQTK